ncbi:MAG: hypothetical protein ABI693_00675 [Bryobacteraceae bacterium]
MKLLIRFLLLTAICPAQTVWFSPIVPAAWNQNIGSADYLNLFVPDAPWATAASHVQVFKMYMQMFLPSVPGSFSDETLQQIFAYLKSHNIALAVEFGPLTPSAACGAGVEGFAGEVALQLATRIQQLGGNLQYIAMDEPFYFGRIYTGPNACQWSPQEVAADAVQNIAQIKSIFPNVIVGDIEPVPATANWLSRYASCIDAWKAAAGSPLPFFHFDVDWNDDWRSNVESMRQELAQRSIPFGIIYNGWNTDQSDAAWVSDAENHYVDWEAKGGTIPGHVIFQSWYPYPDHVLPETDPTAFTYLIDSYFRTRITLTLTSLTSQASGQLMVSQGSPIASAPVSLTAQATSGSGYLATYVLTGSVPEAITSAVIQTCVNECGNTGATDINVYSFQYADSASQTTLKFASGLNGWGVDGSGTAIVQAASDSAGQSMHITATPSQRTFVNSTALRVTPGSAFTLTIQARVPPSSAGSGYFALVFLQASGTELRRSTLGFAPPTLTLGTAQTASDGTYAVSYVSPGAGDFQLQAFYGGTATLWPAFASASPNAVPTISTNGVVNGADFKEETLSPGAWFSIFGQNLGTAAQWTAPATYTLGGAGVTVCGLSAVLSYNSGPRTTGWQLNALVPDAASGQTTCPVIVTVAGQASQPATVNIGSGVMELFVITHADYTTVADASPAHPAEEVIAWGTGDCTTPTVTVDMQPAAVVYSGRTEPGLCQLNFVVPSAANGESQLRISTSPSVYTLPVARQAGT